MTGVLLFATTKIAPDLLCALGALCGETSSELTTEGAENTENTSRVPQMVKHGVSSAQKMDLGAAPAQFAIEKWK